MTPDEKRQTVLRLLSGVLTPGRPLVTLTGYAPASARTVRVRVLVPSESQVWDISEHVAEVLGIRWDYRRPGVAQKNYPGPGRSVAENLARRLYPDGWACPGDDRCPSAEHFGGPGSAPRQAGLTHHDVAVFRLQEL